MKWLLAIVLAGGCATAGVSGHNVSTGRYALASVVIDGVRGGQLSASREWERADADRAVARDDVAALHAAFVRDLSRDLRLDAAAPLRLRATLTLQDTAYFEGLAAEAADLTLTADLYDGSGALVRSITLREAAAAPLQRSKSRRVRLEQALDRLSDRLAREL